MTGRTELGFTLFVVAFTASSAALADAASDAERLFDQGVRAMEAGDYAAACPALEESQHLDPAGGTALDLGSCWEHLGENERAYEAYQRAAALYDAAGKSERASLARDHARALEPKVARQPVAAPAPPPPPPPPPSPPPVTTAKVVPQWYEATDPRRTAAWAAAGAGLISLVGTFAFGALAAERHAASDDSCPGGRCTRAGVDAEDAARTFATVADVCLIATAVLASAATVLFLVSHPKRSAAPIALALAF